MSIVLSYIQARALLPERTRRTVETSLDLGLTAVTLPVVENGVTLPDGRLLTWAELEEISQNELACYRVAETGVEKIQYFSETFNRFYSLMPTESAPTMLVSGIPMHRVKGANPRQDTLSKIRAVAPVTGQVLDTTMGLGYTAIEAAKTAEHVTTIELDPTVVEVCRANPWSQALFNNPQITRIIGDAYDVIQQFPDGRFSRIIHDPPTFSLAGHLYAADFYRQLHRLLKPKGRLFHYVGDPQSKSGRNMTRGVARRLREAGFARIKPWPQAFGVIAYVRDFDVDTKYLL